MTRNANKMTARYPGRCCCGASFQPGAAIYWDGSIRRATGCPSCAPRKAIPGRSIPLSSGIMVRFDKHPDTGAVVLCHITSSGECYGASETYSLEGGLWTLRSVGREPVFSGVATHDQVESWRAQAAEMVA